MKLIIGEGMPYKNYKKGDLFVNYKIEYPDQLLDEQKKLIKVIFNTKDKKEDYSEYTSVNTITIDRDNYKEEFSSDSSDDDNHGSYHGSHNSHGHGPQGPGGVECATQ